MDSLVIHMHHKLVKLIKFIVVVQNFLVIIIILDLKDIILQVHINYSKDLIINYLTLNLIPNN